MSGREKASKGSEAEVPVAGKVQCSPKNPHPNFWSLEYVRLHGKRELRLITS